MRFWHGGGAALALGHHPPPLRNRKAASQGHSRAQRTHPCFLASPRACQEIATRSVPDCRAARGKIGPARNFLTLPTRRHHEAHCCARGHRGARRPGGAWARVPGMPRWNSEGPRPPASRALRCALPRLARAAAPSGAACAPAGHTQRGRRASELSAHAVKPPCTLSAWRARWLSAARHAGRVPADTARCGGPLAPAARRPPGVRAAARRLGTRAARCGFAVRVP